MSTPEQLTGAQPRTRVRFGHTEQTSTGVIRLPASCSARRPKTRDRPAAGAFSRSPGARRGRVGRRAEECNAVSMRLVVLKKTYAIASLAPDETVPEWASDDEFASVTITDGDLSIVAPQKGVPSDVVADRDWRCLKIEGPLDLALTGVLAAILVPLADAGIPVFPVATYQTDYVLLKEKSLVKAVQVLRTHGHDIR